MLRIIIIIFLHNCVREKMIGRETKREIVRESDVDCSAVAVLPVLCEGEAIIRWPVRLPPHTAGD